MQFSTTLAVLGLAALGHAHCVINTPVPFKESITNNDNGPLDASGSDFPCKARGVYTPQGPSTPMALGSSQPLKFTGGATHGGGSCQISITYDKAPTKDSVWKVIHSIQGGCPITTPGNLGGSASQLVPTSYTFSIPNELPTGDAVLAWTWYNRIGNREMYMNCAPISITGGATRRDEDGLLSRNATQLVERDIAAYNALPDMFVANIDNGCATLETRPVKFPNPGSSLDANNEQTFDPTGGAACLKVASGGGSNFAPEQPTSAAAAPVKTSLPGGVFFPVPDPKQGSPATTTAAPVQAAPQTTTLVVVPTKASSAAPPAGTGTAGDGSALTGACSPEGDWNCIGGTSFQRCASGAWSVVQPLAAGTACTPGRGPIDIHAVGSQRRAVRFSHLHRHLRSS